MNTNYAERSSSVVYELHEFLTHFTEKKYNKIAENLDYTCSRFNDKLFQIEQFLDNGACRKQVENSRFIDHIVNSRKMENKTDGQYEWPIDRIYVGTVGTYVWNFVISFVENY